MSAPRPRWASVRAALAAAVAIGASLWARASPAVDEARARRALEATLELDLAAAATALEGADASDPAVAFERARLAIYGGRYDDAAELLSGPALARTDAGADLGAIAAACARATAATWSVEDRDAGVFVRFQDEGDLPLAPLVVDVARAVSAALVADLGVELPRPVRIEVVRDLHALSAMTGLPEAAAQTTGTVAVAKWGRVTMLSPRAVPHGYPWADTLAHEMTHLAVTRSSRDRAPLWLQEGVAKREETRWRLPRPLDDQPPADALAALGFDRGLALPIDSLGASIAMLPSAESAQIAFAEVTSFVRFWSSRAPDGALRDLLARLRSPGTGTGVDAAMRAASGAPLAEWTARWRTHLNTVDRSVPPELAPGARMPHEADLRRQLGLAELLAGRGHHAPAVRLLGRAMGLAPRDPLLRHRLALSLEALGRAGEAADRIGRPSDVFSELGAHVGHRGRLLRSAGHSADAAADLEWALLLDPYDEPNACDGVAAPDVPADARGAALCRAARAIPRN